VTSRLGQAWSEENGAGLHLSERILLTGGLGFIGSHVLQAYHAAGYHVAVLDDASRGDVGNRPAGVPFYHVDVHDLEAVRNVFLRERPSVVNHHAALVSVRESHLDAPRYWQVNAAGTANILRASIEAGVRKFILASSGGAVYGDALSLPVSEDHPLQPLSPYGESKVEAERLLTSLDGRLEVLILRYGNVYGPGQDPEGGNGVVAIFARDLLTGKAPVLYGEGAQLRDFVYVDDAVEANQIGLRAGVTGTYNIATSKGLRIRNVYDLIQESLGVQARPLLLPANEFEVRENVLDVSHALAGLGWAPRTSFEEGLEKTLAWVRKLVERRAVEGSGSAVSSPRLP